MADSPLKELGTEQLRDLYDAEKQLTKALPKLAKAAENKELAQGFRDHLEQTKGHVQRLEQAFELLGVRAKSKPCEAMKGLIKEGQEAIEEDLEGAIGDVALIAAARRVEHYEMAAYDTLVAAFQAMKQPDIVSLLQQTLKEENETDKRLTTMAKALLKEGAKGTPSEQSTTSKKAPAPKSSATAKTPAPAAKKTSAPAGKAAPKKSQGSGSSQGTTDHDEIRQWAEERGGKPACVQGTGGKGDIGLLRLEFPGKPGANDSKLQEISWDDFFEKFDERGLALVYQEQTADGKKSNFNKLISGESTGGKSKTAR